MSPGAQQITKRQTVSALKSTQFYTTKYLMLQKPLLPVQNLNSAVSQLAQTTMRNRQLVPYHIRNYLLKGKIK